MLTEKLLSNIGSQLQLFSAPKKITLFARKKGKKKKKKFIVQNKVFIQKKKKLKRSCFKKSAKKKIYPFFFSFAYQIQNTVVKFNFVNLSEQERKKKKSLLYDRLKNLFSEELFSEV